MKKVVVILAALAALFAGCTRIETGHVGIRTSWDKTVQQVELQPGGLYQTIVGSVTQVVANEMTLSLENLHPQTKDRSVLNDLDLTFTYTIEPGSIAEAMTRYKGRNKIVDGNIYPLGAYVENVVTTATTDVLANYDALAANENRDAIRAEIRKRTDALLKEEGLHEKIKIHQVFVKNLQIDPQLQASAKAVIEQSNLLAAKEREVKTAEAEARRMEAVARAGDARYVSLLNAQAQMKIAEAIAGGKVNTIVVPQDFKGIVNVK